MHRALTLLLACTAPWLCPAVAGQTPTDAPLRKVALVGDDAPGFADGVTLASIGTVPSIFTFQPDVVIDADGEFAFFAVVQGPGIVGGTVEGANSVTLWREIDDVLSLVVQQGDPVPGSPGLTFTGFPDIPGFPGIPVAGTPDVQGGTVAFVGTGGIYVYTDAGLAPIDLTSPPLGLPPGSSPTAPSFGFGIHVEPDGSVLYTGQYDVPYSTSPVTCVGRGRVGAPAEVLLAEGLPVPDIGLPPDVVVSLIGFQPPKGGEDSTDAFTLSLFLTGPGITNKNDEVLLVYQDGAFSLVAREDSPAPGVGAGATFGFFSSGSAFGVGASPTLNGQGQIVFGADMTDGVAGGAAGQGIWTDVGGALDNVVLADEACTSNPDGLFGEPVPGLPGLVFSNVSWGDFNDAGHLSFVARVVDPGLPPVTQCLNKRLVLLNDLSGQLAVVLQGGEQIPGAAPGVVLSSIVDQPRLTRTDHVVLEVIVAGPGITSSNSVWFLSIGPDGGVTTLLRRGDLLDLGGGDVRTIMSFEIGHGISNADEIPVTLSFTDGTAGVFALRVTDHTLYVAPAVIPTSTGGAADFELVAGAGHAGRAYALLGSLSGTMPGVTFPSGVTLPLNVDPFTLLVLENANSPILPGFIGFFDPLGDAAAAFDTLVPVDPALSGLVMQFAWVALLPIDKASEPVSVMFGP